MDKSRREFLGVLSIPALLALTGSAAAQSVTEPNGYAAAPTWVGPLADRPSPEDLSGKSGHVLYVDDSTGAVYHKDIGKTGWDTLATVLPTYAPADLPTDVPEGHLAHDSSRGTISWWDGDNREAPTYVSSNDVETTDDSISNTTTETELFRFDLDQHAMVKGRIFILRVFGVYTTAASTDDFTYRLKLGDSGFDAATGGTTVSTLTTVQENVTNDPWHAKSTIIVDAAGASGVVDVHSEGRFNQTANDDHSRNVSVDTTTAEEFVGTLQWTNAKAGNDAKQDMSYLQQQA